MPLKSWLSVLLMVLFALPAAAESVNGRNVNRVDFGNGSSKLGTFYQADRSNWVEQGDSGSRFNFKETHRDDWSVYLHDLSRNVNIQLDLHTKKVMYSDSRAPNRRPLYNIMKVSAKMNGRLVRYVGFPGGSFESRGGKHWVETGDGQDRFQFQEVGRDEWSVYLQDRPRNVAIQLDLHTRKVMYSLIGDKRSPLYNITDVR